MANLFTYGSLMCTDIMKMVCGKSCSSLPGKLDGYFRSQIQGETYPGIFPQAGEQVEGIVYLDLAQPEIERLDAFEGMYYSREIVHIERKSGTTLEAMTYVIKSEYQHLLNGKPWSYSHFLKRGKKNFLGHYFGFDEIPTS